MKHSFWIATIITLLTFGLTSCESKTSTTAPATSTSAVEGPQSAILDPIASKKNAPTVEESLTKAGVKLKEEPIYRVCIARSVQMCGSEVLSRFSNEKESDTDCDIFEDKDMKNACVMAINTELARKRMDITFCQKLPDTGKSSCERQAITAKAVSEKNPELCGDLMKNNVLKGSGGTMIPEMDLTSQCITQVIMGMAANEKTLKICNDIQSKTSRANCIATTKSRIEMQKNMPPIPLPIIAPTVQPASK